jgi:hypothetical protein
MQVKTSDSSFIDKSPGKKLDCAFDRVVKVYFVQGAFSGRKSIRK